MSIEDEIRQVEEDLARLRAENKDMRDQIRTMGATDQIEISAMISQSDEQLELIAELERRRDRLMEKQKEEGAH
ncbi:unnamed protein product [[Actinomadura] parvosata subsp. kistnae]|uniref:Uncharacterized protein n=2 Tax=Nonomuraea TaxID=83681 RepID=A0A1V0ADW4_9ACTN|nr:MULTISPECIES: hypothetical protein [unclassified Nonomuraea]AQZ68420.1 hypothetical protein BKM31_49360 [Nonomuraea sp. ATCC 55076]NJP93710.1 hypothetical protein [Nonomuraea sp. FMUSA5-5]SPL93136.1 unnamed protein product [Actinomadura parvosata subsp. kistnae]